MLDPTEADILKNMFQQDMPETFIQLYRQAADIEAATGAGTRFVKMSRWLNGADTLADNTFKRAVFMAELQNIVGRKNLLKKMITGRFSEIDEKAVSEAMTEALHFTYQKGFNRFKGDSAWEGIGSTFLKAFSQPGMSLLIPFPRFTHAPVIGLADFPALIGRASKVKPSLSPKEGLARQARARKAIPKRIAQQVTGLGMLYGAIQPVVIIML